MSNQPISTGSLLKPLPVKRAFEEMADQIRDLIFSRKLILGDKFPTERDLAVKFDTGGMAVREALRILEQSGFIQIKKGPGGGAFVRDVDSAMASQSISDAIRRSNMDLQDLVTFRIALEDLIAELAVERITQEEMDQLRRTLNEAEGMLKECTKHHSGELDSELLAQMNIDFHLLLARATKNLLLEINVESLQQALHLHFKVRNQPLQFFKWHLSQHRDIFEAIQRKNIREVKKLMKNHAIALQKRFS